MSKPITAVLFGAGMRGSLAYGSYAVQHPDEIEFVAVAEPNDVRRHQFATAHDIPPEQCFRSWEEVIVQPKMADVVLNMTQDGMHYKSALAALEAGYDMLLEKPMTNTLAETVHLVQTAERLGRFMQICHVLRYTPFFTILHDILASGRIGDIVSVEHRENVTFWHMAHSFVRGNWRNEAESSPMILAKCCHDLDILYWNMGSRAKRLHSFGSLKHYRPENAPPGATARCTDDCPVAEECPFDARPLYLNMNNDTFLVRALTHDLSLEGRQHALETGPYGRCVYYCDNDVVDNQTVSMEFESGATVTLIMHGHSHEEGRTMRYDGTRATLRGKFTFGGYHIAIHDHKSGRIEKIDIPLADSGHGGGDAGIMRNFVGAIRGDEKAMTTARESLESHLMAFAAEESRHNGTVVDMVDFRQRAEKIGD
ncbi:Oxidoreductase family protein [hydrothermal vent metagenome]|uniref:Oxidoreductase family protein n=1 Tax=hydrothermal vent metagenome TaxID=652676 RepID=A0A3B0V9W7_9ZZZZ